MSRFRRWAYLLPLACLLALLAGLGLMALGWWLLYDREEWARLPKQLHLPARWEDQ